MTNPLRKRSGTGADVSADRNPKSSTSRRNDDDSRTVDPDQQNRARAGHAVFLTRTADRYIRPAGGGAGTGQRGSGLLHRRIQPDSGPASNHHRPESDDGYADSRAAPAP